MIYLTLEQLLALHILVIQNFSGSDGIRDLGRLESAVAIQAQMVFDQELYHSIYDKAAALCRAIVGDHPFVDGNKRTAMLAAITLLEINGNRFKALRGELEDFAVYVATDCPEIQEIADWLRSHSTQANQ